MSGVSESAKLNRRAAAKKKVSYTDQNEFEFDNEDDMPLSQMKTKKRKSSEKSPISKSKKVATAKSAPVAKSPSSIFYAECEKGRLVQEVLCRWWYAIDWPDAASKESPGLEYDSLSGLPGVFVCTSGDKVGQILDKRNKSTCPNFQNMVQKSVGDLKSLLAKAISSQKAVLVKNGEKGTETDKILDETADWAKVINDGATEREATKVIAEHGLEL